MDFDFEGGSSISPLGYTGPPSPTLYGGVLYCRAAHAHHPNIRTTHSLADAPAFYTPRIDSPACLLGLPLPPCFESATESVASASESLPRDAPGLDSTDDEKASYLFEIAHSLWPSRATTNFVSSPHGAILTVTLSAAVLPSRLASPPIAARRPVAVQPTAALTRRPMSPPLRGVKRPGLTSGNGAPLPIELLAPPRLNPQFRLLDLPRPVRIPVKALHPPVPALASLKQALQCPVDCCSQPAGIPLYGTLCADHILATGCKPAIWLHAALDAVSILHVAAEQLGMSVFLAGALAQSVLEYGVLLPSLHRLEFHVAASAEDVYDMASTCFSSVSASTFKFQHQGVVDILVHPVARDTLGTPSLLCGIQYMLLGSESESCTPPAHPLSISSLHWKSSGRVQFVDAMQKYMRSILLKTDFVEDVGVGAAVTASLPLPRTVGPILPVSAPTEGYFLHDKTVAEAVQTRLASYFPGLTVRALRTTTAAEKQEFVDLDLMRIANLPLGTLHIPYLLNVCKTRLAVELCLPDAASSYSAPPLAAAYLEYGIVGHVQVSKRTRFMQPDFDAAMFRLAAEKSLDHQPVLFLDSLFSVSGSNLGRKLLQAISSALLPVFGTSLPCMFVLPDSNPYVTRLFEGLSGVEWTRLPATTASVHSFLYTFGSSSVTDTFSPLLSLLDSRTSSSSASQLYQEKVVSFLSDAAMAATSRLKEIRVRLRGGSRYTNDDLSLLVDIATTLAAKRDVFFGYIRSFGTVSASDEDIQAAMFPSILQHLRTFRAALQDERYLILLGSKQDFQKSRFALDCRATYQQVFQDSIKVLKECIRSANSTPKASWRSRADTASATGIPRS